MKNPDLVLRGLTLEQRLDLLKTGYEQIGAELDHAEKLENQATVAICTMIAIGAGFLIKEARASLADPAVGRLVAASFLLLGLLGCRFLMANADRLRNLAQCIVRIEEIFGFFTPGVYFTPHALQGARRTAHIDATLFPVRALDWGQSTQLFVTNPHISCVLFFSFGASALILSI